LSYIKGGGAVGLGKAGNTVNEGAEKSSCRPPSSHPRKKKVHSETQAVITFRVFTLGGRKTNQQEGYRGAGIKKSSCCAPKRTTSRGARNSSPTSSVGNRDHIPEDYDTIKKGKRGRAEKPKIKSSPERGDASGRSGSTLWTDRYMGKRGPTHKTISPQILGWRDTT